RVRPHCHRAKVSGSRSSSGSVTFWVPRWSSRPLRGTAPPSGLHSRYATPTRRRTRALTRPTHSLERADPTHSAGGGLIEANTAVTDPAGCEPLARAARFEALRAGLPAVKYPFPRGGAEVALSEMRHAPRSRHQCRALHPE